MDRKRVYDLDKICRVCTAERKDMRPLFSEKVAEMLMECASVNIEDIEGWPDKICVQCVHAVSRAHAFKKMVERKDKDLREYIKSITVRLVVEEPADTTPTKQQEQQQQQKQLDQSEKQNKLLQQQLQKQQQSQLQAQKQEKQRLQKLAEEQQRQQQQQQLEEEQQQQRQKLEEQQRQKKLLEQQRLQQKREEQQKKQKERALAKQQQVQKQQQLKEERKKQQEQQRQKLQLQQQAQRAKQLQQQQQQQQQQLQLQKQRQQQMQQQQLQLQLQQQQAQAQTQTQANKKRPAAVARKNARQNAKKPSIQLTPLPALMQSGNLANNQQTNNLNQLRQQQQQMANATPTQLIPATATAVPQQLVLSNGQVIAAHLLTHQSTPQITQVYGGNTATCNLGSNGAITINNAASNQSQFAPQFLQTTSGQTLQIIQQPNGTQTLQLVQIVPQTLQQNQRQATIMDVDLTGDTQNSGTLMEPQVIDESLIDTDDEEDEKVETIVLDDEQHQLFTAMGDDDNDDGDDSATRLSQDETQELEYLEDITITTSGTHGHYEEVHELEDSQDQLQHQHQTLMMSAEEDDMIEEIHIDDEDDMIEHMEDEDEEAQHNSVHLLHTVEDDAADGHVKFDEHDLINDDLQYTVIEYGDDELVDHVEEAVVPDNVQQVAICDHSTSDLNETGTTVMSNNAGFGPSTPSARKSPGSAARKTPKSNAAVTRQLAATASCIAAAEGDDDQKLDEKLIAEFISHQTTALGAGRYVCNLCRQEFRQFRGLHNHMVSHRNWIRANCKKQPQCEICQKSFKGPGMLKMHMKTHQSASITPVCNICHKTFKSKAILYRHRQSHQLRGFICHTLGCRKSFSTHMTLQSHLQRKHGDALEHKCKCGECELIFNSVERLQEHMHAAGHGAGRKVSAANRSGRGGVETNSNSGSISGGDNSLGQVVDICDVEDVIEQDDVEIDDEHDLTNALMASNVNGDMVTLHNGQQLKFESLMNMRDVVVVTTT